MPNERTIEQLLQAYRQKRREAAGGPLSLHPATRNLLQGEIARTLGASRTAPASLAPSFWLAAFWPRLAVGGALTALAAFVVLQVNMRPPARPMETTSDFLGADEQSASRSHQRGENKAAENLDQRAVKERDSAGLLKSDGKVTAASARALAADRISDPSGGSSGGAGTAGVASAARGVTLADSVTKESKPGSLPAQNAPVAVTEGRLELGAFRRATKQEREMDLKLESQPAVKKLVVGGDFAPLPARPTPTPASVTAAPADKVSATSPLAPTAPAAAAPTTVALAISPAPVGQKAKAYFFTTATGVTAGTDSSQRYRQVNARPDLRQNLNSPPLPAVLTDFQVAVTGETLRITDADGSTYEGRLVPNESNLDGELAAAPKKRQSGLADTERKDDVAKRAKGVEESDKLKREDKQATASAFARESNLGDYGFVVTGTNRRLNQLIEFKGNFVPAATPAQPQAEWAKQEPRRSVGQSGRPADLPVSASAARRGELQLREALLSRSEASAKAAAGSNSSTVASGPNPTKPTMSLTRLPAPASNSTVQSPPTQIELPTGLSIRGRAMIGGSNEFEIRAVPATKP